MREKQQKSFISLKEKEVSDFKIQCDKEYSVKHEQILEVLFAFFFVDFVYCSFLNYHNTNNRIIFLLFCFCFLFLNKQTNLKTSLSCFGTH